MSHLTVSLRRYFNALGVAAVATFGLFWLMQHLIQVENQSAPPDTTRVKLDPFPEIIETPPTPPPPIAPPLPVETPPLVALAPTIDVGPGEWGLQVTPPKSSGPTLAISSQADGDLMSLAMVTPQYPERAKQRGIQGYVIVEFSVDSKGAVRNPVVVDAQPSGIFDKAAVTAIVRSKFRPKVLRGKPQPVHGVRKRITFELGS